MSSGIKVLLGVLGGALLMLVLFVIFGSSFIGPGSMMGQGGMMGQQGWWGPGGMMYGGAWGLLWMLVPLLFWGGILLVIVWAVIRPTSSRNSDSNLPDREESAEEILRKRFARGEIDDKEYESKRRVLLGQESAK